jgi:hypothetical protein
MSRSVAGFSIDEGQVFNVNLLPVDFSDRKPVRPVVPAGIVGGQKAEAPG